MLNPVQLQSTPLLPYHNVDPGSHWTLGLQRLVALKQPSHSTFPHNALVSIDDYATPLSLAISVAEGSSSTSHSTLCAPSPDGPAAAAIRRLPEQRSSRSADDV